jgi:dienelactone hydrolase
MLKPVTFFSEGVRLAGDLYLPDVARGEKRAGIVLCHGYTGVRNIYLPDNARALAEAGYVVLNFDYKGWGDCEGPKTRLAPYSRVADVQAALTFLAAQPGRGGPARHLWHELWRGDRGLGCRRRPARQMHGLRSRDRQRRALDAQRAAP